MKRNAFQRKPLPTSPGNGYPMPDIGKAYRSPVLLSCQVCGHYIKNSDPRGMENGRLIHAAKCGEKS